MSRKVHVLTTTDKQDEAGVWIKRHHIWDADTIRVLPGDTLVVERLIGNERTTVAVYVQFVAAWIEDEGQDELGYLLDEEDV